MSEQLRLEARQLLRQSRRGMLSTHSVDHAGYPFGSVVNYAVDDDGVILLLISALAVHTRNLAADARCSLLVMEEGEALETLALGRLTLLGEGRVAPSSRADARRATFLSVHPSARMWAEMKDFSVYELDVVATRYVAGFGRMTWLDGRP